MRLPFARDFFDAVVSVDSYVYYGTDDLYLAYLARLVKPGGQIGIAGSGLVQELDDPSPSTCGTGGSRASRACTRPSGGAGTGPAAASSTSNWPTPCDDGWRLWLQWQHAVAPDNQPEIQALESDRGRHLGYVRAVARRRADVELDDPIGSIPSTTAGNRCWPPSDTPPIHRSHPWTEDTATERNTA